MNKYKTCIDNIIVNDYRYKIRKLKDRQQYYDPCNHAKKLGISAASWPLFGVVWPSAHVLANTVSLLNLEGKRILEIGCGIALASIALHKMGFDVTASDNHPLVKEFLNQNILNNNLSPIKYETGDWNIENPLLGDFDFIIGSDILYEPSHAKLVSAFIDAHSSKSVEVVIVDPNRSNSSKFIAKMDALGYSHEYEPFIYPTDYGVFIRGRILYFHR